MHIQLKKPIIYSILFLMFLFIILWMMDYLTGSYLGFNRHIFVIFWIGVVIIFFIFNRSFFTELQSIELKEKRDAVIRLISVGVIAVLYYLLRLYAPMLAGPEVDIRKTIYSLLITFVIGMSLVIYLAIHSLFLSKGRFIYLSIIEFLLSIGIYIGTFLFIFNDDYLGLAYAWPFALGIPILILILIIYVIIWLIKFFAQINQKTQ